jgi:hypothetical protein
MLSKLISFLDLPDSDYWSDVACCEARALIDQDSQSLLNEIFEVCEHWSENRQEHLAYILGEGASPCESKILDHLSKSVYPSVAFRAREALRAMETRNA